MAFVCACTAGIVCADSSKISDKSQAMLSLSNFLGNGISITKASAENVSTTSNETLSCTLTATLSPGLEEYFNLGWEAEWYDSNAAWAKGKSVDSYVEIVPSQDTYSVTINCLQAFGETISLRAYVLGFPMYFSTCALDYARRPTSVTISISGTEYLTSQTAQRLDCDYTDGVKDILLKKIEGLGTVYGADTFKIDVGYAGYKDYFEVADMNDFYTLGTFTKDSLLNSDKISVDMSYILTYLFKEQTDAQNFRQALDYFRGESTVAPSEQVANMYRGYVAILNEQIEAAGESFNGEFCFMRLRVSHYNPDGTLNNSWWIKLYTTKEYFIGIESLNLSQGNIVF